MGNPRVVPLAWFRFAWEEQESLLGRDPWAYGLGAANCKNIETALGYTRRQGLVSREMAVSELFVNTDNQEIRETNRI
jgi:4,5-dihydroxyphthalate decarboxylase